MADGVQLGDLPPGVSIAVGILVGLASTSIQSVGLTLQRKSHLLEDLKNDKPNSTDNSPYRPPYRRRRWQVGMFMFVIANLVGSTIQITTLPLPVLSTLQASGLVFNTLCASLILHEPFTRWSFIGTALVAGGAVLIALFGALAEPSHNLDQLLELLGRRQFLLWMFSTFFVIGVILVSVFVLDRIFPHSQSHGLRVARGFAYGGISSILSAHSLLVAKSAVELIIRTIIDRHNQFNHWQSWMILVLLVVFALTQLYFLHRGLKLVSTSILYPFVFCIYNIIAILDGLIYFRQTDRLPALYSGLIALGTVILLSGVLALSWRTQEAEERETQPPPDIHTFLTPGMGIVEDTSTESEDEDKDEDEETWAFSDQDSDIDRDNASTTSADEDTTARPDEATPLLGTANGGRNAKKRKHSGKKHDGVLSVSKTRRKTPTGLTLDTSGRTPRRSTTCPENLPHTNSRHARTHADAPSILESQSRHFARSRGSSATPSRTSSPETPINRPTRARTVFGTSSVTFARGGTNANDPSTPLTAIGPGIHTRTWRQIDRERRRRRWSIVRRGDHDNDNEAGRPNSRSSRTSTGLFGIRGQGGWPRNPRVNRSASLPINALPEFTNGDAAAAAASTENAIEDEDEDQRRRRRERRRRMLRDMSPDDDDDEQQNPYDNEIEEPREQRNDPEPLANRSLTALSSRSRRNHSRNVSSASWFSALMGRRLRGDVGSGADSG